MCELDRRADALLEFASESQSFSISTPRDEVGTRRCDFFSGCETKPSPSATRFATFKPVTRSASARRWDRRHVLSGGPRATRRPAHASFVLPAPLGARGQASDPDQAQEVLHNNAHVDIFSENTGPAAPRPARIPIYDLLTPRAWSRLDRRILTARRNFTSAGGRRGCGLPYCLSLPSFTYPTSSTMPRPPAFLPPPNRLPRQYSVGQIYTGWV